MNPLEAANGIKETAQAFGGQGKADATADISAITGEMKALYKWTAEQNLEKTKVQTYGNVVTGWAKMQVTT